MNTPRTILLSSGLLGLTLLLAGCDDDRVRIRIRHDDYPDTDYCYTHHIVNHRCEADRIHYANQKARLDAERREALRRAEEQRLHDTRRLAEQKQREAERRLAEARRKAELQRQAELKRQIELARRKAQMEKQRDRKDDDRGRDWAENRPAPHHPDQGKAYDRGRDKTPPHTDNRRDDGRNDRSGDRRDDRKNNGPQHTPAGAQVQININPPQRNLPAPTLRMPQAKPQPPVAQQRKAPAAMIVKPKAPAAIKTTVTQFGKDGRRIEPQKALPPVPAGKFQRPAKVQPAIPTVKVQRPDKENDAQRGGQSNANPRNERNGNQKANTRGREDKPQDNAAKTSRKNDQKKPDKKPEQNEK